VRYAWEAVRRRPGRSAASALGIGLATALVVTLLSVSNGIQASANRLAVGSGVDLVAASANSSLSSGAFPVIPGAHRLPEALHRADGNVVTASPWLTGELTFANRSLYQASNRSGVPVGWAPTSAGAVGWIPSQSEGLNLPSVLVGPGYPVGSDPLYANGTYAGVPTHAIVLDQGLASVLRVAPGDLVWGSPSSPGGPQDLPTWFGAANAFRVVGVSGPFWLIPSALLAFLYLSEFQLLLAPTDPSTDAASLVLIHLDDPAEPARDQSVLARAFPGLSVFTLANILTQIQDTVAVYRTFGTLIGFVGLVVATLFATTVLLMSVDDRSRELALLRALGFGRSTVVRFVVEEGVLISAFGLIAGLGFGYIGSYSLNRALAGFVSGLPAGFSFVQYDLVLVITAVAEVSAIALIASVLPAIRALQLPVAQELRAP
jgi:ABC-type lipoprotein release transport system permease subunit